MLKVLFLIHDLGQGGAEKVLVNLVNNMDRNKFDISVTALFGGGINEQFLKKDIHYQTVFPKMIPANSKWMKLISPKELHNYCVKDTYDIEISYLEGPSARIVSGCSNPNTKLVCWIHGEQRSMSNVASGFRSKKEAKECYSRFNQIICVSEYVQKDFLSLTNLDIPCNVIYNTVESKMILEMSAEKTERIDKSSKICLISVGTLKQSKGFQRLINIMKRLVSERYPVHLYILGTGPMKKELENLIVANKLQNEVTLLGYDTNPYKYVSKCDLFVCASFAEGFSTAATEALIVGTPVCTVNVSGMKEMLGSNNEYGLVTENTEDDLYKGIKKLLDDKDLLIRYREKGKERGQYFSTDETVESVEKMLEDLVA